MHGLKQGEHCMWAMRHEVESNHWSRPRLDDDHDGPPAALACLASRDAVVPCVDNTLFLTLLFSSSLLRRWIAPRMPLRMPETVDELRSLLFDL
uniref:Uncharacterized protein n=1 Tax=Mycena chlorophos TaxID=658473 RepID=A0ABQ0L7L0_MYCCL|nr:predicted protein [Mycena chlorophos]